jgi:hypothetical protein
MMPGGFRLQTNAACAVFTVIRQHYSPVLTIPPGVPKLGFGCQSRALALLILASTQLHNAAKLLNKYFYSLFPQYTQ